MYQHACIYKLYIYVYKVFEQSGEKNLNDDSRKWNEYKNDMQKYLLKLSLNFTLN